MSESMEDDILAAIRTELKRQADADALGGYVSISDLNEAILDGWFDLRALAVAVDVAINGIRRAKAVRDVHGEVWFEIR